MENNYFNELNSIDLSGKIEKKNGLSYVSWSFAWQEIKKRYPNAQYTIYENANGMFYHTDGKTCWVKTGVTVNELEHIEYLPVMDFKNKSIPVDNVTSMDVNKAIQRSLTKACARHGLGLYVYAGEDLPEIQAELGKVDIEGIKVEIDKIKEYEKLKEFYLSNKDKFNNKELLKYIQNKRDILKKGENNENWR